MMKGFIRILESIAASVILLSSISFFFSSPAKGFGWDDTNAYLEIHDSLESVYKSDRLAEYVKNNDAQGLNMELSSLIEKNIDFSASINGIPNNRIFISCLCTEEEKTRLDGMMTPSRFEYHGRIIEISAERVDAAGNSIVMREETDILFLLHYEDLSLYKSQLNNFLSNGGSIFMIADLSHAQAEDGFMNETFGLMWNNKATPSGNGRFYGEGQPANISFKISKYYSNLTDAPAAFTGFNKGGNINKIEVENGTIVIDNNKKASLAKGRKNIILGNGRAMWAADYNDRGDNINTLMKAAVMWASGESYRMDPVAKKIPQVNNAAGLIVYDKDPYEFRLNYWNIF
ncbi:MAG: hypothetical protein QMD85_04455 [Candidatus Aenigmarchaeota archaeon]|nr:hypothetical protein [Candidatus Aenigmarchaeota archaeon]MDI6722825.1 hypothetical protein [Candidatus Aenigmarchaeota archaeon]